ncbi:isoprenylcysteine carboxylmethyltransferase family protein [candidate division TA06 bacterium]|nr:isoprenylcysteine carboxylmethyltransferase family protein [candidate division TA06 bacterium]
MFILTGLFMRLNSVGYVGEGSRGREVGGEELVIGGPYTFVRNPLYLGNFFLSLGFVLIATGDFSTGFQFWAILIFILLFTLQYVPIVLMEEKFLRENFGESYEVYCRAVPRFLPRLDSLGAATFRLRQKGRLNQTATDQGEQNPTLDWGKAIRSERSTFWTVLLLYGLFLLKEWFL